MKEKYILYFICLLIPFTVFSQKEQLHLNLAYNNIASIESYAVSIDDEKEERLMSKESFNKKGRRTNYKIFKQNGSTTEYTSVYLKDTIKISTITKFDDVIQSKTILSYDNKNRHTKSEDFDQNGKSMGNYEIIKYKKKGRTIERKLYTFNRLRAHTKMKFDKDNVFVEQLKKSDNKWIKDNWAERKKERISNFNNSNLDLVRTKLQLKERRKIIGLVESLELNLFDELVTEKYFLPNGLVTYELQFLNGEQIGKKRYKYTSY